MRVLLGVVYYEPAWAYGGPPKLVSDLARQLTARGHEVAVCTTDALDGSARVGKLEETRSGVRIVRFRNLSNRVAYRHKIFVPLRMRGWLEANVGAFDVVHLFDARTPLVGWGASAAARTGTPFVWSVLGSLPRGTGWRALVKGAFDWKYRKVLTERAAAFLAQNEHERQLYIAYGASAQRVQLWPLAVDPAEYANLPAPGGFRGRFGIGPDDKIILFVGRIHELKGLSALVQAFARLRASGENVRSGLASPPCQRRLVIVGRDDGFLEPLQRLVRELGVAAQVVFSGPLYGADVLPAYADCDLFCITPTHYEETSLSALVACACGKPVLINDRCDIPWLEEYEAGRCVPHAVDAVAQALGEMLDDESRLRRMGRNARRMIDEKFAWPRVADQVEKIYETASRRGN